MILRRLRGIVSTAVLWGIAWALISGCVAAATALLLGARLGPLLAFTQGALTGLFWGLAAGALFGSALMLAEQGRDPRRLTLARSAAWGALGGVWFPVLIGLAFDTRSLPLMLVGWPAYLVTGSMGALSAVATLWLARRGPTSGQGGLPLAGALTSDRPSLPSPAAWPISGGAQRVPTIPGRDK